MSSIGTELYNMHIKACTNKRKTDGGEVRYMPLKTIQNLNYN